MCLSTVCIRRFAPGRSSFEVTSFSTARTTPSFTRSPIAVLKDIRMEGEEGLPSVVDCFVGIFNLEETTILNWLEAMKKKHTGEKTLLSRS